MENMNFFSDDYLMHHGILGQKWGVRRFQNKDGSLTSAGKKRKKPTGKGAAKATIKSHSAIKRLAAFVKMLDADSASFSVNKWRNTLWFEQARQMSLQQLNMHLAQQEQATAMHHQMVQEFNMHQQIHMHTMGMW